MKKAIFKKVLCIINYINLQVEHIELFSAIQKQLQEEDIKIDEKELFNILTYINEIGILYKDQVGYDLIPCGCVFAKANNGSISEALAFFECLLKQPNLLSTLQNEQDLEQLNWTELLDTNSFNYFSQTTLWNKETQSLNPVLLSDMRNVIKEYGGSNIIISDTLSAIYTNELIDHRDSSLKYRNIDSTIVEYNNLRNILNIIPKLGIPENRDITRPTQTFYKDTLMHEFHHTCPICGIDIPHMLIASHIKPFRDCAHIFETLDHHNGLLLCRNHDYLFDQGLFTFDESGKILISKSIKNKPNLVSAFGLSNDLSLAKEYSEGNRQLFLNYHRNHIYKD